MAIHRERRLTSCSMRSNAQKRVRFHDSNCNNLTWKISTIILIERTFNIIPLLKMVTKRPLPQRSSFKADKKQSFKGKDNFQRKNTEADKTVTKSSLRKSNSDGILQLSVTSDSNAKKSVTFSQDVLTGDSIREFDCNETEHSPDNLNETSNTDTTQEPLEKRTPNSRLWSHPGVVIQNGFEMREASFQGREGLESSPQNNQTSKDSNQQRKSAQSSRAKLLAKLKESPIEKEPCACRTVTRPTAALLAEARKGDAGTRETSTRNERLLVCIKLVKKLYPLQLAKEVEFRK